MNKIKVGAHAQYLVQECVHAFVCVCVCVCVCVLWRVRCGLLIHKSKMPQNCDLISILKKVI